MTDLIPYLDRMITTTDVEDLWSLHADKMKAYGFDRLIYGFTRFGGRGDFGSPDDWLILSTQTPEYMRGFIDDGICYDAPMMRWALENRGACSWSWMRERATAGLLTPAEQNAVAFNQRMNVTAGYTISFLSVSERIQGAIALTAEPRMSQDDVDALWAEKGCEVSLINNVMHLKLQSLPYMVSNRRLTNRQREVLHWVADGKSVADVAILLNLTPATVEKHLRLARESLGVETTAQAVLKASLYNQTFVVGTDPRG